ncbi:hypothetical protein I3F58_23840 [Streptomyces sp. MUM 203J]|uniref:hypothetical protein n=1 Tax=Streptomyces sp. MUM 203J TaxID=2791990 RepID=UPI001F03C57A|nr:hypothetical protein [Streptomyces sp. MUM 203J]MCH0542532.1 hypothetical protein [Streptomyces sp. MUM 203J]
MLALRLARAAHPLVLARRLLVTAASAGVGFLLLCALGYAVAHPDRSTGSVVRLAWCALPLAATVYLAVAVARTDPSTRPRPGLSSLGLGPGRLAAIAAASTAVSSVLGSALALLVYLHLRGDLTGLPFDNAAAELLAAGQALPVPAALTLLAVTPVAASAAVALTLRPRGTGRRRGRPRAGSPAEAEAGTSPGSGASVGGVPSAWAGRAPGGPRTSGGAGDAGGAATPDAAGAVAESRSPARFRRGGGGRTGAGTGRDGGPAEAEVRDPFAPAPAPAGLPWGVALIAMGLAVEVYGAREAEAVLLPLPGGVPGIPVGVVVGWALTAVGLAVAGPGLAHLCGRLVQAYRPGATRLLAGRALMDEARRIGRPLGVLCGVVALGLTAATLYARADTRPYGPLTSLGACLVLACTAATVLTAALETRQVRSSTRAALIRLGAPAGLLRSAALLRTGVLLAVFAPLTWAVAGLAALPLTG